MTDIRNKKKKYIEKNQAKASLTVEAAVIVPLILFTITRGLHLGYDLFQDAKESVHIEEALAELDPVDIVRKNTTLQEVKQIITGDDA